MAISRLSTSNGFYHKTELKNGLRVVTERMPSIRSLAIGVWVDVGSRNEQSSDVNGVSHMIEHALFKGTKQRTAKQIASSLEFLGGSLNAFTSKEQTCYTARVLDRHLEIAVDVLSDITCNSTMTPVNLSREKNVILEEIKEAEETPSDHIHDLFAQTYWGGDHPLGRPILGHRHTVASMRRAQVIDYFNRNYRSGSIVIAAVGSVSHNQLVKLVREKFRFPEGSAEPHAVALRSTVPAKSLTLNSHDQIHLCIGYPALEYAANKKMAALVLQSYLGGGMSSVLFQKIREDHGLAYVVDTFLDFYRDAGIFGAYMATDRNNVKQCLDITLRELRKVSRNRLSDSVLTKMKEQMQGQLMLGMESTVSRMNRLARLELMLRRNVTLKDTLRAIDRVTAADILELANRFFDNSQAAIAVLGPAKKSDLNDVF